MKKSLKIVGIAGALCIGLNSAAANASATYFNSFIFDGVDTYSATFGDTAVNSPTFTDHIAFNFFSLLPTSFSFEGGATVVSGHTHSGHANATLTQFDLYDVTAHATVAAGTITNLGSASYGDMAFNIANNQLSDQFELRIAGHKDFSGASYAGNIAVSAVPEPETYAMLLAGLGLIGFVARRRRTA